MLLQKPARVMLDNQIDFHIIPADVFAEPEFYRTKITDVLTVNGHCHDVLVIPYAQFITEKTAQAVERLIQNGGKVLFIDALPESLCTGEDIPAALKDCRVTTLDNLATELKGLCTVALNPASDRVRALHYTAEKEIYYLFNESDQTYRGTVTLPMGEYHLYDAWNDRYEHPAMQDGCIKICLAPSHSLIIVRGPAAKPVYKPAERGEKISLTRFTQSVCRAIEYPNFSGQKAIIVPNDYAQTDKDFSGIIRYEATFEQPARTLEITDAYEGVEVFINGESLGIQVAAPFVYDLRGKTQDGCNRLTIEVATTLERERNEGNSDQPTGLTGEVTLYL